MKKNLNIIFIGGFVISGLILFSLWILFSTPDETDWKDDWIIASKRIAFETSHDVNLYDGPTAITTIMGGYLFTGTGSVNYFYKEYYSFIYSIKVQNGIVTYCSILRD